VRAQRRNDQDDRGRNAGRDDQIVSPDQHEEEGPDSDERS
jgi:hypothetical protein